MAEKSYSSPKVRGSGQEELLHVRGQRQQLKAPGSNDRERQAATVQERLRGATPQPRSSGCTGAGGPRKATPRFKVSLGYLVQGKEQRLHFTGAAVKRNPKSRVRETQVRWEVLREGIRGQTH